MLSNKESSFKRHSDIMDKPLAGDVHDGPNLDALNAKFIHRYNRIIIPFENNVADLERDLTAIASKFGTDLDTYRECSSRLDEARELLKAAQFLKPRYEKIDQLITEFKTKLNLIQLGWGGLNYIGMPKEVGDSPVLYFKTNQDSPLRFGFNFSTWYEIDHAEKIGDLTKVLAVIMFDVNDPHLESLKTTDDDDTAAPESFHIFEITSKQDEYKQNLQSLFNADRNICGSALNPVRRKYLLRAEVEFFIKALVDLVDKKYLDLFKKESIEININDDEIYEDTLTNIGFSYGKMRNAYGGYE